mmetsp:Transcript_25664/g.54831  ORF Transcript_25664/g.54831 Transcript_25664/m.54831 type:complete len:444 (-) Transcript_25664:3-1334(-)
MDAVDVIPTFFRVVQKSYDTDVPNENHIGVDEGASEADLEMAGEQEKVKGSSESVDTESISTQSEATESITTKSIATESIATDDESAKSLETADDATEYVATESTEEEHVEAEPAETEPVDKEPAVKQSVETGSVTTAVTTTMNDGIHVNQNGRSVTIFPTTPRQKNNGEQKTSGDAEEEGDAFIDEALGSSQESQEYTYEDYEDTNGETEQLSPASESRRERRRHAREERRKQYNEIAKKRMCKIMCQGVFFLCFEIAAATIAIMNNEEFIECCGRSVFSENEAVGETWNQIFYWMGITYLLVLLLIEIPTLLIANETLFLFNPLIGFLLSMHMIYVTDVKNAFTIFGLETVAMLGQTLVLSRLPRGPESFCHALFNYTFWGITTFTLLMLTKQGGYCIVDNRIQSVYADQTCNVACIDEATCSVCNAGDGSADCFIRFPDL